MLSKQISDADEAIALNYAFHENHIYSCSWGPPDDGRAMDAPGILIQKSMVLGIQNGRDGLGSVFVFASGNGAAVDDNCNFDGYTNSIYSITVGAVDRNGEHPYYSEACSANMVVTYSSGGGDAIVSLLSDTSALALSSNVYLAYYGCWEKFMLPRPWWNISRCPTCCWDLCIGTLSSS